MKYQHYILACMALPVLVSCGEILTFKAVTAGISAASHGVFSSTDVNLMEKNYAAADFLAGQMGGHVNLGDVILAEPLEEVDHAGISSPLGLSISEGVGLRFGDLGYKVQLHKVAASENAGLYPPPTDGAKADYILKGSYLPNKKNVEVFLRVMDMTSGQVIARFDYTLLLSKEVKDLSKTQTRIFRVSE